MKWNQLLLKEFTEIIKSKKILIPIIAVLFVPILYAGMFLWAFWDPYKQLDDLPVAVVNLDKGAVFDGKPIEVGKGLVDNLKDNTSFKWEFVSEKEAKKGMEGRKYYMLVRIPDDFSSNATTLLKDDPKPLNLEYIPNESLNFLSSQIGGTAIEKIKGEVSSTLTKTYAEKMFDSIQDVSKGLADGAEGANKLHDGSSELHDGSSKVTDGLHTLQGKSGEMKDGVGKLADGSNKLVDGSGKVTNGLNTLNSKTGEMQIGIGKLVDGSGKVTDGLHVLNSNAGIGKLVDGSGKVTDGLHALNSNAGIGKLVDGSGKVTDGLHALNSNAGIGKLVDGSGKVTDGLGTLSVGVSKLADGSGQVTGGLGTLSVGVTKLADGSSQVTGGLGTLSAGVNQLADGSGQVTGGLGTLSAGANQMAGGVNQLADGSSQVTDGLGTLSVGANQMAGGVNQLADGSNQVTTGLGTLNGGLNKMSTGSTQLIDGVNKLADGSGKVTDGLEKVNDGSGELAEKLGEGAEKTGEVKGTDKTYDMFASPVKVKTEKMAEVPNYGTGFTPYFLSLGLFVGALLLSIVYPLRDTVGVPKSGFSWFISKFGVLLSVGIIQAIVADVILLFGLGVEVQSIPYFILFSIVTSLAFIALIQCLVTAFGDAGRFIAIITLIIQLTTSAGTFPLELIPKFLQPFNAWLPMTYSVSGLKAVVSSGDFNFMWQNVGVLMIFIVVLSLGTIASLTWMHKRQFRNIAENQSIEA
ncbi:YhgE/Pip family protein [Bacillus mobilis]|uniref:YhgE/Pip family protein n=1 Tax=Bacillus mobilis TaxID=2026190 RepID=UPI003718D6D9